MTPIRIWIRTLSRFTEQYHPLFPELDEAQLIEFHKQRMKDEWWYVDDSCFSKDPSSRAISIQYICSIQYSIIESYIDWKDRGRLNTQIPSAVVFSIERMIYWQILLSIGDNNKKKGYTDSDFSEDDLYDEDAANDDSKWNSVYMMNGKNERNPFRMSLSCTLIEIDVASIWELIPDNEEEDVEDLLRKKMNPLERFIYKGICHSMNHSKWI